VQRVEVVDDAIRIMDRRWNCQGRLLPAIAAIGDGWRSLIYTGLAEKESEKSPFTIVRKSAQTLPFLGFSLLFRLLRFA